MPGYNPPIAHYCHVSVSNVPDSTMLKIIGKNGFFFKKITQQCQANYLWWNKESKVIEIWGSHKCMALTKYNVEYHVNHINDENYKYSYQPLPYFNF